MGAAVQPLQCGRCGAPVPLGEGDVLDCPFCSATVAIPEGVRQVRALNRVAEADRGRVEALYRQLGEPPGPMLRFWTASDGVVLTILRAGTWISALVILCGPLWLNEWLAGLAPKLGFDPFDVMGPLLFAAACALAFHLLIIAPFIYGTWRNATGAARNRLAASLAARSTHLVGGPSMCRRCGAPLSMPADALGVRCDYCGADNLVRLPPEFVKRWAREDLSRHDHVVGAVEAEQTVVHGANRRGLRSAAIGLATLVATTALWRYTGGQVPPRGYREVIAETPRRVFIVAGLDGANRPTPRLVGQPLELDPSSSDCWEGKLFQGPKACERSFWVALRKGEQLRIVTPRLPEVNARPRMAREFWQVSRAQYADWSPTARGAEAVLLAPYSGWFRVEILVPVPEGRTAFTFEIAPAS